MKLINLLLLLLSLSTLINSNLVRRHHHHRSHDPMFNIDTFLEQAKLTTISDIGLFAIMKMAKTNNIIIFIFGILNNFYPDFFKLNQINGVINIYNNCKNTLDKLEKVAEESEKSTKEILWYPEEKDWWYKGENQHKKRSCQLHKARIMTVKRAKFYWINPFPWHTNKRYCQWKKFTDISKNEAIKYLEEEKKFVNPSHDDEIYRKRFVPECTFWMGLECDYIPLKSRKKDKSPSPFINKISKFFKYFSNIKQCFSNKENVQIFKNLGIDFLSIIKGSFWSAIKSMAAKILNVITFGVSGLLASVYNLFTSAKKLYDIYQQIKYIRSLLQPNFNRFSLVLKDLYKFYQNNKEAWMKFFDTLDEATAIEKFKNVLKEEMKSCLFGKATILDTMKLTLNPQLTNDFNRLKDHIKAYKSFGHSYFRDLITEKNLFYSVGQMVGNGLSIILSLIKGKRFRRFRRRFLQKSRKRMFFR